MSLAKPGETIVVAESLAAAVALAAGIESHSIAGRLKGKELEGSICRHPLRGGGYDFDVPALAADFVEVDTGSIVHIAPGHGRDDWELGVANGVAVPETVGGDGLFGSRADVRGFARLQGRSNRGRGAEGRGGTRPGALITNILIPGGRRPVDFPQHGAVVHFHGSQRASRQGLVRHKETA